jgi:pimeloyl-ACP methyl ester carboxylesterase
LDCAAHGGKAVIAPRLIHPSQRERIRRMGYPFGRLPIGFELAYGGDRAVLYGAPEVTRPEELGWRLSIVPHDESVIERSTQDTTALEAYLLGLIPAAARQRARLLQEQGAAHVAQEWRQNVVGELPVYRGPWRARERVVQETATYRATEIVIDALPGVIAQGVLLEPRVRAGKRPLVVLQHGLEGSPEVYFGRNPDSKEFATYRNFGETLLAAGFTVYCPQNPYKDDFRRLQLLAHPRGLSLFSFIAAQYRRTLDYLETRPGIDPRRIVYYGLSYGGATALRVPNLDPRFRAIVCAGNFNDWIPKLVDPDQKFSYLPTREYEMFEWRQAWVASHAELAALGLLLHRQPIPFFVERGHADPVGVDDWVAREFQRLEGYAPRLGLVKIAYFDGIHRVDGVEALAWLRRLTGLK